MLQYAPIPANALCTGLFAHFIRRQEVTACWRQVEGRWVIRDDPFVDDWTPADIQTLVACLRQTLAQGGLVAGAFFDGKLKGFVSVEAGFFGTGALYLDLSNLHVSADLRGQGVGRALFSIASDWARGQGAQRLYLSAHSAVETQAFYKRMGCVPAQYLHAQHVAAEPFDRQLEYAL